MANEIVRGGTGNFGTRIESVLGASAASWEHMYLEEVPAFPTNTRQLIENSIRGFRNPLERAKPVAVEKYLETAFRVQQRIRRASTDGDAPIMEHLFKSAGWQSDVGNATTTTGSQSTTLITVSSAASMAVGEAILVEDPDGVYQPVLIGELTGAAITPSIALSQACGDAATVEIMNAFSPYTSTGYQVTVGRSLQFKYGSLGYYDDAIGDLSVRMSGCAVADLGAIEIEGTPGSVPMMDWGIHVGDIAIEADDIAADSFTDSSPFVVINSDAEFAIADTNAGSGIGTLVTKHIKNITVNPGLKTIPIPCVGAGGVNGLQGYVLVQEAPTISFTGYFRGDDALENDVWTELEGSNTSKYIHFIQPTRDLDHPAFGIWMPNCHLKAGSEPSINFAGDLIEFSATYEATLGAWGDEKGIDSIAAAPIVIAVSNEAA